MRCLERAALESRRTNPGLFCCGKCSVGLWRNLLSGSLNRQEERLRRGAGHLRSMRDGNGQWNVRLLQTLDEAVPLVSAQDDGKSYRKPPGS